MQQINQDIKQQQFHKMYLLYGEERYLCKQYTDRLRAAMCNEGDTMNTHFYEGKDISVGEIIDLAETIPFLAERRVIIVKDSGLFKSGGEQLADYLASPCGTAFFIFTESEVDKRSKLFKTVSKNGHVTEFATQDENTLKRWIAGLLAKEGKKISEQTATLFLSKTGSDMNNIRSELEKLICYCMDKDVVTAEDVEAICTIRISNQIFDMIGALAENKQDKALALYYDLLALKEPPMRILFLIARQCNLLLQAKEMRKRGHDNRAIASAIGIPPFIVGKYLSQADRFKTSTLRRALQKCVETEEASKSGKIDMQLGVEILLMSVFRN